MDPGQHAKASTALDLAQFTMNTLDEMNKAEAKVLKDALKIADDAKAAEIVAKQGKLAK